HSSAQTSALHFICAAYSRLSRLDKLPSQGPSTSRSKGNEDLQLRCFGPAGARVGVLRSRIAGTGVSTALAANRATRLLRHPGNAAS
ncbi:unnamed protein product, partial [Tilletia laevis]